jgi:hypothetical protein
MTWTAVETGTGATTQLGTGAKVSATLSVGTYNIIFSVTDPTSGQTSTPSITLNIQAYLT